LIEIKNYIIMRIILIVFSSILLVFSCTKQESTDSDILGRWRLTEVLLDPGDGSGTFQSVSSDKIIEFHSDGTVTSNGEICYMSIDSNSPSNGTYSISKSTIYSSNCSSEGIKYQRTGTTIVLSYPNCDEPCATKFIKE
jgi:hypothetical protein